MKSFRWSTFAGASLGALVFTFAGPGSAFANSFGSSGGGSSGGGSSGGGSHGSIFKGHGSSGGSSHGSLFAGHGSSGGSSHGNLFTGHGSSGGSSGGSYGGSYGLSYNGGSVVPTTLFVQNMGVVTGSNVVATTPAPSAAVAYLNVNVPADAKVYLQDQLMPLEGTQRRFVSPELPVGSQHVYNVRVDVVRDGQTVSKTTQALVTAGQEIAVSVQLDTQNSKELVATVATVASR
jgi:uncharacterized protein (TIGR03000 family)